MTNSPTEVPRIPDYQQGMGIEELRVSGKLWNHGSFNEVMDELWIHAGGNDEHISVTLSWAMELIEREGLTPAQALEAAMVFYFG
jgi:hypothetical protein